MKKLLKVLLALIIVFIILVGGAAAYVYTQMQPVKVSTLSKKLTLDKGLGTASIADRLEQEGVIKNGLLFKVYLKVKSQGSHFQAGVYEMNPGITYDQIIDKLNHGDIVKAAMMKFTIPEGYTIKQITEKLSQEHDVDSAKFLALAKNPEGINSPLLKEIPADNKRLYRLEGLLFPETYDMKKGSTEAEIITRMLNETQSQLDSIPDFKAKLETSHKSLNELLTAASLIEREVVADPERSRVASVIDNRLKDGMKLEIDATVQYLLGKPKERLVNSDLRKIDNPYNTYIYKGLPPGPIASPSLKSIEAVLNPEITAYKFYVTKKDGSQEHLFAKTYAEHLVNIKKSQETAK
ncbi:UPF0755 protein [Paenibacillus shirakamiensis]|uniref:Endolytic murein transglycosylase n=1 Tax=Paenibacillus shirakamiensis TaxID=1265935 RepID=A0ABS4JBF4_9BACL|nr:endolytic transglycosylase MltG [Paenibacillus shirakamiensis]MBP1999033.1 UPF0755 protein [Paenibacillus shirakamiensis]